ncbi:MAG TPA: ABC transporter permease [Clostridia bacterium]|nr:ABC transporter permease [Clostridia bacterium]
MSKKINLSSKGNTGTLFTIPVIVSLVVLGIILICSVFAPLISPYDPYEQDLSVTLSGPTRAHLLGADSVGRDVLTRLFYGGRTTILGGLAIVFVSIALGLPLGLICGYYGGVLDALFMRACDIVLAFPSLLLAFVLVAGLGRNMSNAIIALGIVYVPGLARLVRSLTMVEKNKVYVEALHSMCYSDARIMFVHIIPNCMSSVVVQLTLDIGYAVLDLAGMSFLGFGVQPPTADWGNMLNEGRSYLMQVPLLALAPGICIILLAVSINIFSDGLYRYLEPKQRKLPTFRQYDRMFARKLRKAGAHADGQLAGN